MYPRRALSTLAVLALMTGWVAADTKIVKQTHTDGFQLMGQEMPARDSEVTTWLGADRMQIDDGETSMIVRLDRKKMYIVNHAEQTYSTLDVPIDPSSLLPPGMAEGMMEVMKFSATVTPSEETQVIEGRLARRYDVALNSPMVQISMTSWASRDVVFDVDAARNLSLEITRLSPGMDSVAEEMSKIDGYVVLEEKTSTMMGNQIKGKEKVISITKGEPPAGTYEPPESYTPKQFNFAEMMGQK